MRNECTTVSFLNANSLPERNINTSSLFYWGKSLEVWSIFRHRLHEAFQALELFWRKVIYQSVLANVSIRTMFDRRTESTDIHDARTNAHEKNTILLILRTVLGHDDVQGGLESRVQSRHLDVIVVDELKIGVTAGEGDDFLHTPFQDQGEEEVVEVDVANDVGLV
jgi:hypothetical protein